MPAYPPFACRAWTLDVPMSCRGFLLSVLVFTTLAPGLLVAQCYAPGSLQSMDIRPHAVTLTWNDGQNPEAWEIEICPAHLSFTGIPSHSTTIQPLEVTGLTEATRYKARIRAVCQGGTRSAWTFMPVVWTTAGYNPSSCGLFFPIDDENCPQASTFYLQVDNAPGQVLGQDATLAAVDLVIRHTFLADLHIVLVSPSGQEVVLFREHGQSRDHLGQPSDTSCLQVCRFSSSQCDALPPLEHAGAFTGTFVPDENLTKVEDGGPANGIWQLKICDDARADTGSLRFVALHFDPIACSSVQMGEVTSWSDTAIGLQWSVPHSCDTVLIEYGPSGFAPGNGHFPGVGGMVLARPWAELDSVVITGLMPGTTYDIYWRTYCAAGGFSSNSCSRSVHTDCSAPHPPAHQAHFDSLTSCGFVCLCRAAFPLGGLWQNNETGDDFDWLPKSGPSAVSLQTGPFEDVSGTGNYLMLQTLQPACQSGAKAILQSGCLAIDPDPGIPCHISFYYHMWGAGMGTLLLEGSKDGGIHWVPLWSLSGNQGSAWHKQYVRLDGFAGDTIQLRFTGISGPSRTSQMALDEIALYGLTLMGPPDRYYYRDADGDGYGNPLDFVRTCSGVIPDGYVQQAADCDDSHASIHPGANEVPCNGLDENCNGEGDDRILPAPMMPVVQICAGADTFIQPLSEPFGQYYWYAGESDQEAFHTGPAMPAGPWTRDTFFYLLDSVPGQGCSSSGVFFQVRILEAPELVFQPDSGYCIGDTMALSSIPYASLGSPAQTITYHRYKPTSTENMMDPPVWGIDSSRLFWVKAVSQHGCMAEIPLDMHAWESPIPDLGTDTLAVCKGKTDLLVAEVTGGMPPYAYQWTNGFQGIVVPVSAPDTSGYWLSLSVMDQRGCTGTDAIYVAGLPGIPALQTTVGNVSACGGSDGSIRIEPLDPGAFHYAWAGPVSGEASHIQGALELNGLAQGSYRITLTHAESGCMRILPSVVVNGPGPLIENIDARPESCAGLADGEIGIYISGGPAQFIWSTGDTTQILDGLGPGFYSVTVTGGGCSIELTHLEVEAASPLWTGSLVEPESCPGTSDGSILVTQSGGKPPYSWVWSDGIVGQERTGLSPGIYHVTLTDANGCMSVRDSLIIAAHPPVEWVPDVHPSTCSDTPDGQCWIQILGGQPPFQVLWSDGFIGEDRPALLAGEYRATITDDKGCSWESPVVQVPGPAPLDYLLLEMTQETCAGSRDGIIRWQAQGGTPPYFWQWSDGLSGQERTDLVAGSYAATLTDQNGCARVTPTLQIGVLHPLILQLDTLVHPTCQALADGRVRVTGTGGSGAYTFLWSDGSTGSEKPNALPGNYSITLSDALGCTTSLQGIVLEETEPLKIALQGVTFPQCGEQSEGQIDIHVSGTPPYQFAWSHGYTGEDPKGVGSGFYSVTVVDGRGCVTSLEGIGVVNADDPYTLEVLIGAPIRCHGDSGGEIEVVVHGGEGPYQFNWNTGQEKDKDDPVDLAAGLPAGEYAVTVTDYRGCVLASGPVVLEAPPPLHLQVPLAGIKHETCFGHSDGQIQLLVSGGAPPYATFWDKDGVFFTTGQHLTALSPGHYLPRVEDSLGCTRALPQAISIQGPPSLMEWWQVLSESDTCTAEETGRIELKMTGGVPEYSYLWSDGGTGRKREGLHAGIYCVTVSDQYDCVRDTCLVIGGGSGFQVIAHLENECDPYSFASVEITGGLPPYHVTWSHGATGPDQDNLPTGIYYVTVEDATGCGMVLRDLVIGHPVLYIDSIWSLPSSPGGQDGMAGVVVQGGTPPYSILWDVNTLSQTGDTAVNLAPGNYCVWVTDAFFCSDTACVDVPLSTGVSGERSPVSNLELFPNPAGYQTLLRWWGRPLWPAPVEVILRPSAGGWARRMIWDPDVEELSLELAELPAGTYWVEVRSPEVREIRKLVVMR